MEMSPSRWFHKHQQWLEHRTALQLAPTVNQTRSNDSVTTVHLQGDAEV
jgi:hypothetical protein